MRKFFVNALCLGLAAITAPAAYGQAAGDIRIDFTNNLSQDGFFFTPVWFAFQDGANPDIAGDASFDQFNVGEAANSLLSNLADSGQGAIEALAEDGFVDGLVDAFDASGVPGNRQGVITNADGFAGAPVIDPGETGTAFITPINPSRYQYITLASMLIPSNDVFIGNDSPSEWLVFDTNGDLIDPDGDGFAEFDIFAVDHLFDAGTEEDNAGGAAFAPGALNPGVTAVETPTTENIALASAADLNALVGITTAAGTTITADDIAEVFAGGPLATVRVSFVPVPEPTSFALIGLGSIAALVRRKRS